jgi:hypothetical protein
MTSLELSTMLNVALSDAALLQKIDDVASALAAGHLVAVTSNGDTIETLAITPSGRKRMQPVLPWGSTA